MLESEPLAQIFNRLVYLAKSNKTKTSWKHTRHLQVGPQIQPCKGPAGESGSEEARRREGFSRLRHVAPQRAHVLDRTAQSKWGSGPVQPSPELARPHLDVPDPGVKERGQRPSSSPHPSPPGRRKYQLTWPGEPQNHAWVTGSLTERLSTAKM